MWRTSGRRLPAYCSGPNRAERRSNAADREVYSYKDLIKSIAGEAGRKPILFPVPFAIWYAMARATAILPNPPITRNQVELMEIGTVASPLLPGFADVGILPQSLEETVRLIVRNG
jgi:hypothetical protein